VPGGVVAGGLPEGEPETLQRHVARGGGDVEVAGKRKGVHLGVAWARPPEGAAAGGGLGAPGKGGSFPYGRPGGKWVGRRRGGRRPWSRPRWRWCWPPRSPRAASPAH